MRVDYPVRKRDGRLSLLVFGVQLEEKEIKGRLTMITSVLDALPIYMMSHFHIPQAIVHRMDKIKRSFLWLGNKEKGEKAQQY
ncbi:hypothetical protein H5410_055572 [Solanum commersonii]|uniref:Uncharacterized protein n=1 Tax=Solanum commersonii TaxID=4109 RepID=A0A9J5WKN0_SOLCO|nr:hypothetical protein H5410_055572 [Solanum commersonii]